MHASLAYVNGAGDKRRTPATKADPEGLRLLNALLSTATTQSPRPARVRAASGGRQGQIQGRAPGGGGGQGGNGVEARRIP